MLVSLSVILADCLTVTYFSRFICSSVCNHGLRSTLDTIVCKMICNFVSGSDLHRWVSKRRKPFVRVGSGHHGPEIEERFDDAVCKYSMEIFS